MANAREAILGLLNARASEATICPSEVARSLTAHTTPAQEWREKMPEVHLAVDTLVEDGLVRLSWKGEFMRKRAGPYRMAKADKPPYTPKN